MFCLCETKMRRNNKKKSSHDVIGHVPCGLIKHKFHYFKATQTISYASNIERIQLRITFISSIKSINFWIACKASVSALIIAQNAKNVQMPSNRKSNEIQSEIKIANKYERYNANCLMNISTHLI